MVRGHVPARPAFLFKEINTASSCEAGSVEFRDESNTRRVVLRRGVNRAVDLLGPAVLGKSGTKAASQ